MIDQNRNTRVAIDPIQSGLASAWIAASSAKAQSRNPTMVASRCNEKAGAVVSRRKRDLRPLGLLPTIAADGNTGAH